MQATTHQGSPQNDNSAIPTRKVTIRCCFCDYVHQERRQILSLAQRITQPFQSWQIEELQTEEQQERRRETRCPKCGRRPESMKFAERWHCRMRALWRWFD
jgi:Zn finger protein HypA/HybF involved in hydrogenase expression